MQVEKLRENSHYTDYYVLTSWGSKP